VGDTVSRATGLIDAGLNAAFARIGGVWGGAGGVSRDVKVLVETAGPSFAGGSVRCEETGFEAGSTPADEAIVGFAVISRTIRDLISAALVTACFLTCLSTVGLLALALVAVTAGSGDAAAGEAARCASTGGGVTGSIVVGLGMAALGLLGCFGRIAMTLSSERFRSTAAIYP